MESTGNMDRAVHYYKEAKDHFSLVRVLCFQQNLSQASEIASATGDRAACYHLARQYEAMGKISEAVHFFSRAQAYGTAVRICKVDYVKCCIAVSLVLLCGYFKIKYVQ